MKITTVVQARALPEVDHPFLDRKQWTDDKGITHVEETVRPLCPRPLNGDQIMFFRDADGRAMQIVYTPDGPAKTEWHGI